MSDGPRTPRPVALTADDVLPIERLAPIAAQPKTTYVLRLVAPGAPPVILAMNDDPRFLEAKRAAVWAVLVALLAEARRGTA